MKLVGESIAIEQVRYILWIHSIDCMHNLGIKTASVNFVGVQDFTVAGLSMNIVTADFGADINKRDISVR